MGSSRSKSDSRVLHVRLGRPLTSAPQEPHFAALQFQRTARSGAPLPWIQWRASRTTIPSSTGTSNSSYRDGVPGSPRNTRSFATLDALASSIAAPGRASARAGTSAGGLVSIIGRARASVGILASMGTAEQEPQLVGHLGQRGRGHLHRAVGSAPDDAVAPAPAGLVGLGMVDPAVGAAALGPLQGTARDRLGDDEQVAQLEDEIPARVECPPAADADGRPARLEPRQLGRGLLQVGLDPEDADQALHDILEVAL